MSTAFAEVRAVLQSFAKGQQALALGVTVDTVAAGAVNRLVRVRSTLGDWAMRMPAAPMRHSLLTFGASGIALRRYMRSLPPQGLCRWIRGG